MNAPFWIAAAILVAAVLPALLRPLLAVRTTGDDRRPALDAVRASGEFRLADLACGRYRLRFGSLDELEAGRFQHELALAVMPGESPALEIEL